MGHENDTFSLVCKDDGETSIWRANVNFDVDKKQSTDVSTGRLRLAVENDFEMVGDEIFRVIDTPVKGILCLEREQLQSGIESFDLDSVRRGEVVFLCDDTEGTDCFSFQIPSDQMNGRLQFQLVRCLQKLRVKLCAKVEVSVGGRISLGKDLLETTSPNSTPDEVLYTVSRPKHGHLIFESSSEAAIEVSSFSQTMLNDGHIAYQHSGDTPNADHFRFNVVDRNGSSVGERMFRIRIVNRD